MQTITEQAANLRKAWETDRRWAGIERDYTAEYALRLRGSLAEEHTLARRGAQRLWELLQSGDAVLALEANTDIQAVQQATAGPQALYLSGFQVPQLVRRINNAMQRPDPWAAPIVAEAEAEPGVAFGSVPGAFELMKSMIEAGAAGVHFEDQLSFAENRGHPGGKVLIPTGQHIETLRAARLAADVLDVPALVIARTGAHSASLLTSDADERDHEFLTGERTAEGFHRVQPGRYARVRRGLEFAPYADVLWLETSTPSLAEARAFAAVIYSQYPDQLLAYSCSPSFNWGAYLDDGQIAKFQRELAAMGYRFQLITSPGRQPRNESKLAFAHE